MRSVKSRWALLFGLLVCLWSGAAFGLSKDELARKHFESGVAYLEESDYENALAAFKKAYELSNRPEILLNVATVHERLGQPAPAIAALEEYLKVAPNGEHADTVRRRIENLQRREADVPPPASPPGNAVASEPAPVSTAPVPAPAPVAPPPPPPPPPPAVRSSRVPVYLSLGVGAASGIGAVVTGVLAQQEYNDAETSCKPSCSDDEVSSGKSLALTSTILTGVAVVGIGVGVTLWLIQPSADDAEAIGQVDLGLAATPAGPTLSGRVLF
jgi:tetratricopeptide (TPR) repeat protein